MKTTKKISYTEALATLENIVASLGNNDLNVDELAEKVKQASQLLQYCKNALYTIESEVNELTNEEELEK